jgi:hypothetical protein
VIARHALSMGGPPDPDAPGPARVPAWALALWLVPPLVPVAWFAWAVRCVGLRWIWEPGE